MEVAVIYSKDCVFSQNTETIIRGYFNKMITSEIERLQAEVKFYDLREIEHPTVAVTIRKVNVKIVILSHHFLEHLTTTKQSVTMLNRILQSHGVIAILVRVNDVEIRQNYIEFLPHYEVWSILELRSSRGTDQLFYQAFKEQVIKSYNIRKGFKDSKLTVRIPESSPTFSFDQSPLNETVYKEMMGTLHVSCFQGDSNQFQKKITINLDKYVGFGDNIRIELRKRDQTGGSELFYAAFDVPELVGSEDSCNVEVRTPTGANEILFDQRRNSLAFDYIIQNLPAYRKCLDEHISDLLSKHFRAGTSFEADPELTIIVQIQKEKSNIFPTIMHFAVYYGLDRTVWTLLEEGDGSEMCDIQNTDFETPQAIAERMGYSLTIGKTIQDYKDVMVTWEALQYMKILYETTVGLRKPSTSTTVPNLGLFQHHQMQVEQVGSIPEEVGETSRTVEPGSSRYLPDVVIGADDDVPPILLRRTSIPSRPYKTSQNEAEEPVSPSAGDLQKNSSINEISPHYARPPSPKPILPPKKKFMEIPEEGDAIMMLKKDGTIPRDRGGYIVVREGEPTAESAEDPKKCERNSEEPETDEENNTNLQSSEFPVIHRRKFTGSNIRVSSPNEPSSTSPKINYFPDISPGFQSTSKPVCTLDPSEVELMEWMIGVKEKQISQSEIEGFFLSWKDRDDVKQDYKEKQKDLEIMREKYAKIQAQQEGSSNRPLFERLVKMFGRTRQKKSSSPSPTDSEASILESRKAFPSRTVDEPPQLLERKVKARKDSDQERVWGNAMSRKCVGISYIDPTMCDAESPTQDSGRYLDVQGSRFSDDHYVETTDPVKESYVADKKKQDTPQVQNEKLNLENNDYIPMHSQKNPLAEQGVLDGIIPPPIPPKTNRKKNMTLTLESGVVPVPPPRNLKDRSLHFVHYNEQKKSTGTPESPDYKNSPNRTDSTDSDKTEFFEKSK